MCVKSSNKSSNKLVQWCAMRKILTNSKKNCRIKFKYLPLHDFTVNNGLVTTCFMNYKSFSVFLNNLSVNMLYNARSTKGMSINAQKSN